MNISSTSSRLARPGVAHYGASKAGLNQLTAVAAVELAPHGIRVNAILPGEADRARLRTGPRRLTAEFEQRSMKSRIVRAIHSGRFCWG